MVSLLDITAASFDHGDMFGGIKKRNIELFVARLAMTVSVSKFFH